MSVEERVRKVLGEHLTIPLDQIALAGRLVEDYGFDSLDKVEFGMALEEEFQVFLEDDDIAKTETLQDYLTLIEAQAK